MRSQLDHDVALTFKGFSLTSALYNRAIDENKPEDESQAAAHYIFHHDVKRESATTPTRIVFDCSCKLSRDHPSLNKCLKSTPSILNKLTSILLRFGTHQYAVTTEIEKAFSTSDCMKMTET